MKNLLKNVLLLGLLVSVINGVRSKCSPLVFELESVLLESDGSVVRGIGSFKNDKLVVCTGRSLSVWDLSDAAGMNPIRLAHRLLPSDGVWKAGAFSFEVLADDTIVVGLNQGIVGFFNSDLELVRTQRVGDCGQVITDIHNSEDFARDVNLLVIGDADANLYFWNLTSDELIKKARNGIERLEVTDVEKLPNGNIAVASLGNNAINIWDVVRFRGVDVIRDSKSSISGMANLKIGGKSYFLTATRKTIRIYSSETLKVLARFRNDREIQGLIDYERDTDKQVFLIVAGLRDDHVGSVQVFLVDEDFKFHLQQIKEYPHQQVHFVLPVLNTLVIGFEYQKVGSVSLLVDLVHKHESSHQSEEESLEDESSNESAY